MTRLTEFEKVKQKEWQEFGESNVTSGKKILFENIWYIIFGIIILFFAFTPNLWAGEWNDKPVICANEIETFQAINDKEEELIFKAVQFTKVRTDVGLAKRPVGVQVDMYVNPATGTYTIIEFHPTYESYCVISYGTNFQVFIGGVQ